MSLTIPKINRIMIFACISAVLVSSLLFPVNSVFGAICWYNPNGNCYLCDGKNYTDISEYELCLERVKKEKEKLELERIELEKKQKRKEERELNRKIKKMVESELEKQRKENEEIINTKIQQLEETKIPEATIFVEPTIQVHEDKIKNIGITNQAPKIIKPEQNDKDKESLDMSTSTSSEIITEPSIDLQPQPQETNWFIKIINWLWRK